MKKITLFILLTVIFQISASSQSCLPEGIFFETQAEIDNFQTNYPNCIEIEGDVTISGDDISNLNGLTVLTTIGGNFMIGNENGGNPNLSNLGGLENITSIGGNLFVVNCNSLSNLIGLNGLTYIEGGIITIRSNSILENLTGLENLTSVVGLEIDFNWGLTSLLGLENLTSLSMLSLYHNAVLTSLEGLNNITAIEGIVWIDWNESLTSFSGLDNLISVGDELRIHENFVLENITSLNNLNSIGGSLSIASNGTLTSLSGLDNIDAGSINDLSISNNGSLSTCEVQSICSYLSNPNGTVTIYSNASGCNGPPEIADACGIALSCLPFGNYYFTDQIGIDSFQINYSGCSELEGFVSIRGSNITSLAGLNQITFIGGDFAIFGNHSLTSLDGLESLTDIHGDLFIGGYDVWPYYGEGNHSLIDLTGLENLTGINGDLTVKNNPVLPSLSGLDNIGAGGFFRLFISENDSLSICEIQSVCNFLGATGNAEIQYNAIGCNSEEEVEEACSVWIQNTNAESMFTIFPNPAKKKISILTGDGMVLNEITIYNQLGQKVLHKKQITNSVDVSMFEQGAYIIEMVSDGMRTRKKLMIGE